MGTKTIDNRNPTLPRGMNVTPYRKSPDRTNLSYLKSHLLTCFPKGIELRALALDELKTINILA